MQPNTQAGFKRLLHFAAVLDRLHKTGLVDSIGNSESLLNSLQKIGSIDQGLQYKANAFVHKIPFLDLNQINIDHARLTRVCDPTAIHSANYAAVMAFGDIIWVVSDKPAAPVFRQKIAELVSPLTPIVVTSDKEVVMKVAEQARAAFKIFKDSSFISPEPREYPSKPEEETVVAPLVRPVRPEHSAVVGQVEQLEATEQTTDQPAEGVVQPIGDDAPARRTVSLNRPITASQDLPEAPALPAEPVVYPDQNSEQSAYRTPNRTYQVSRETPALPSDIAKKFTDCLKKIDRECATAGKTLVQTLTIMAYGIGADKIFFTPNEGANGMAEVALRLHGVTIPLGTIKMNTYPALSATIRDVHSMGKDIFSEPTSGQMVVRFQTNGQKYAFESSCIAVGYGTGTFLESYTLNLSTPSVDTAQNFIEDNNLSSLKLGRGIMVIGSPTLVVRQSFFEHLTKIADVPGSRVGVIGLPGADGVKFSPHVKSDEPYDKFIARAANMGVDKLFIGKLTADALQGLVGLGSSSCVAVGVDAASMAHLFQQVVAGLGSQLLVDVVSHIMFVDSVPLLCSCSQSNQPIGCESCGYSGFSENTLVVDKLSITAGTMQAILKKSGAQNLKLLDVHKASCMPYVKELFLKRRLTKEDVIRLLHGDQDLLNSDWFVV